jgi:hypothetical protein
MGEDSAGAAGEDGGHVEAFALEEFARDERVDATVDAVEAARRAALLNGACGDAERPQLVEPKDSMLPRG